MIKTVGLLGIALFVAPVFATDELGRLFFTPEQRAMLDLTRRAQAGASPAANEAYEGLTLSGVVTRSDGKRTVWINGQPQPNGVDAGRSPAAATIALPSGEGKVKLRVGQTLDPTSGKVEEGYRRPSPPQKVDKATTPPRMPAAPTSAAVPDRDDERADDGPAR